jgi:hypothetical protein
MANALPHGLLHREPTQGRQQKDATVPAHGLSSMQQRHLPFQRWLLLASAVAALLIAFLGWHIYESHRFFGQVGTDFVRQTETIARVRQLRWKLTQAAHHVVLFGDGEDRRRAYGHGKRRLEAELDAGVGLPQQVADRASLAVLAELSRELGAIEGEAMAAARDGRRDDALSLLHSPDYVEGTGVFCARADAHLKAVYERLEERLQSHGASEIVFFSVDVAVLVFAGTLWWLLGVRLQRWRALADSETGRRILAEVKLRQAENL